MTANNKQTTSDKLSMGLSLFIVLCVVAVFCAISIAIIENVTNSQQQTKHKHVNLPNNREFGDFVL